MSRMFTHEQRTVVHDDHPRVIVSAAAGSGKTTTLRARVHHLLHREVLAREILVLSFANRSVDILRDRIDNERIRITTFHAFAWELVRAHTAPQGHGAPRFVEPTERDALLESAINACPTASRFVRDETDIRLGSNAGRKQLAAFFVRVQGSDELARRFVNDPASGFSEYRPVLTALRAIRLHYEHELDNSGGIDYAGMLRRGCDLLRSDAVRLPYRHVLIDEAQDLSAEQAQLLSAIVEQVPHVMAFGDSHQAIFGFMGADFRNLHEALPDAVVLPLSRSFRLTHEMAATANAIVNDRKRPVVGDRFGRKPVCYRCRSAVEQEQRVIGLVSNLIKQGAAGDRIAILATTKMQLRNMEHALRGAGYETEPMYWTRVPKHVDSILDLLTFVEKWKWAVTADGRIRNRWTKKRLCQIVGVEPDAVSREVLAHCRRRLVAAARASSLASRYVIVSRVYLKLVSVAHGRDVNMARELECWEAISRRFDKADRLRTHIAALRVQPKVVMSTIHGAKGAEWNHVIVLNVTEGALPLHHAIRTNTVHEEQRLFYVAVTRARERLYLFHAPYRHAWSGTVFAKPSRFLTGSVLATLSGH